MTRAQDMEALLEANRRLEEALEVHRKITNRALADYQQQVLELGLVRQRTEDLELLTSALGSAKRAAERRAVDSESRVRLHAELLRTLAQEMEHLLRARDPDDTCDGIASLFALVNDVVQCWNGDPEARRVVSDVRSVVDECITIARRVLGDRAIRVELAPGISGIATDAVGFRQLLLVLLYGAAERGKTDEIALSLSVRGDALILGVPDSAGWTTRTACPSARRRIASVMVRQLVRCLGGTVTLADACEGASNLTVTLPGALGAVSSFPRPAVPRSPPAADTGPATVLVVHRSAVVQELVRARLEPDGFRVVGAATTGEVLAAVHRSRPDAVIVDPNECPETHLVVSRLGSM